MKAGGDLYMWFVRAGGVRTIPLGVFDEPPPEDAPTIRSVNVGGGRASKLARDATKLVDEGADFIDALVPG